MLHGPSGVGKNHISRLLARSMFTNGVESRFVNYYSSSRHFREVDKVEDYRRTLDHEIKSNLTVCDRQLFIFDEARRFPPKLLDSLAPFFDPGMISLLLRQRFDISGAPESKTASKSVFMFIYEGDSPVVEWAVELKEKGVKREDITIREAEERITPYVHQDKSLNDSLLIQKGLIQHHLPFLPLENHHVRQCIKDSIVVSDSQNS